MNDNGRKKLLLFQCEKTQFYTVEHSKKRQHTYNKQKQTAQFVTSRYQVIL